MDQSPQPIPAATLILFRDSPAGPEHLFVERAAGMAFAGGAVVFPGGRVDAGDRHLADRFELGAEVETAARIAAIRETLEETGVAVGLTGDADPATVARMRAQLVEGVPFADVLAAAGMTLDPDALTPFARWCPLHERVTRIFDTQFYIARAPADVEATVDATENVRLFWATARAVLEDADAGQLRVIFPTRRNLERLATLPGYEAALEHCRATPVRMIAPVIEQRDGTDHLCIPEGLGYPVTAVPLAEAMRG